MNRLEKMCAEAQKELQSLQGQYKKEAVSSQPGSSEVQTWNQEPLSESGTAIPANKCTVPSDHRECESSHLSSQEFLISCDDNSFGSQNVTTLKNIVVVDMTDSRESYLAKQVEGIHPQLDQINSEWTNLNQQLSFQTSNENPDATTNTTHEAINIYKCQECGKIYNSRCSFTNHMHYHQRKKLSSMVNAEPSPGGQESNGTTHLVNTPPLDPKIVNCAKPTQTFTFEYCGKVFNSQSANTTHTIWHLKKKGLVTQGSKQETKQVSSFTTKKQKSDRACTSSVEVFTCKYCGRVFNKLCAYTNHSRWHVKEKELQNKFNAKARRALVDEEHLKEGDTKNTLNHDMSFDVDTNKGVADVCIDDGNVQGYCRLVRQLSLDEQHNLPSCEQVVKSEEPSRPSLPIQMETKPQTIPEVLESVLELVVGTEEVHEILLSKAGLVFRKTENYENAEEVVTDVAEVCEKETEEKQVSGMHSEPAESQIARMHSEPAENQIPGLRLKPEKAQNPGKQLEPEKKIYFPKMLPSRIAVQCLSRPRPPYRCRDCGIRFHQIWRLKQHRLKGFGKTCTLKKHQCDCGRTPIGSLHFLLHQLQHLSDTAFTCAVCSKTLSGYRKLQAHSLVHPLVSQFQCKCGTRFTKLPRYLWHSLKNKAKPKTKMQMGGCTGALL
ncbi:unnamed protein product [Staurois parvus]|uniref:C2H2-type domain-containing protein n=1 Tax=Staurois parvus TaxID=386267 RepID=A0ABN9HCP3_9NEOB|nr:unnamed protein product [Staurois parvus]